MYAHYRVWAIIIRTGVSEMHLCSSMHFMLLYYVYSYPTSVYSLLNKWLLPLPGLPVPSERAHMIERAFVWPPAGWNHPNITVCFLLRVQNHPAGRGWTLFINLSSTVTEPVCKATLCFHHAGNKMRNKEITCMVAKDILKSFYGKKVYFSIFNQMH